NAPLTTTGASAPVSSSSLQKQLFGLPEQLPALEPATGFQRNARRRRHRKSYISISAPAEGQPDASARASVFPEGLVGTPPPISAGSQPDSSIQVSVSCEGSAGAPAPVSTRGQPDASAPASSYHEGSPDVSVSMDQQLVMLFQTPAHAFGGQSSTLLSPSTIIIIIFRSSLG
ncbi:hypothetical protein XENOCAPTIV_015929, partial [Xenoophorus captivus]